MFAQAIRMLSSTLICSNTACGALFAVYAAHDAHGVAVCRYCDASLIELAGNDSGISVEDDADAVQVFVRRGPWPGASPAAG